MTDADSLTIMIAKQQNFHSFNYPASLMNRNWRIGIAINHFEWGQLHEIQYQIVASVEQHSLTFMYE